MGKIKEWIKECLIGIMIVAMFTLSLLGGQIIRLSKEEKKAYRVPENSQVISGKIDREISSLEKTDMEVLQAAEENVLEVPEYIIQITEKVGRSYNISPEFLQAMAWRESRFDPDAVNKAGTCFGLMQVSTKWHGHRLGNGEDIMDPGTNIRVAAEYLQELFERYKDPAIVLMIYNGDSHWKKEGYISSYATDILELASVLEK